VVYMYLCRIVVFDLSMLGPQQEKGETAAEQRRAKLGLKAIASLVAPTFEYDSESISCDSGLHRFFLCMA